MDIETNDSSLTPKEKALVALVAYLALGRKGPDLDCTISSAKKEGVTETEVSRIKGYIDGLKTSGEVKEESLSSLLAKATKSTCCS